MFSLLEQQNILTIKFSALTARYNILTRILYRAVKADFQVGDAVDFRYFVSTFPNAKFLHLSLMQSILGILYAVLLLNAKFLRLSLMQ